MQDQGRKAVDQFGGDWEREGGVVHGDLRILSSFFFIEPTISFPGGANAPATAQRAEARRRRDFTTNAGRKDRQLGRKMLLLENASPGNAKFGGSLLIMSCTRFLVNQPNCWITISISRDAAEINSLGKCVHDYSRHLLSSRTQMIPASRIKSSC